MPTLPVLLLLAASALVTSFISGILGMAVEPLPTMHPSGEVWVAIGHPVAPDKMAMAVGSSGSTYADHGMRWDNSGKNGHYAPISWSN